MADALARGDGGKEALVREREKAGDLARLVLQHVGPGAAGLART